MIAVRKKENAIMGPLISQRFSKRHFVTLHTIDLRAYLVTFLDRFDELLPLVGGFYL